MPVYSIRETCPVFPWNELGDSFFHVRRISLGPNPKPQTTSKDVGIDDDAWLAETGGKHKVRRLPAYAGKLEELLHRGGHRAAKPPFHDLGRLDEVAGLCPEKAQGSNRGLYVLDSCGGHAGWVGPEFEESGSGLVDLLVRALGRESDGADQLEGAPIGQ